MDKSTIILCQNVQHSRAGTQQILINAQTYKSPILCIQEPYTFGDKACGLTGYNIHSSTIPKTVIATVIPNVISIQQFITSNCVCVLVNNQRPFLLISVYLSPNAPLHKDNLSNSSEISLEEDLDHLNQITSHYYNIPIIFTGDFNGWHPAWGSATTNLRGEAIFNFISSNQLIILNDGTSPTRESGDSATFIDITFVNNRAINMINDWKVLNEITHSDHNLISFQITNTKSLPDQSITRKFKTKNVNWDKFNQIASKEIQCFDRRSRCLRSAEEVNDLVDSLSDTIIRICECTLPRNKPGKRSIYWFNNELKEKQQKCKRLRRKWKRSNNQYLKEIHLNNYIEYLKEYKNQLISTKKESIRQFYSIQDNSSIWKQVYKWCKTPTNLNQNLKTIKTDQGWTSSPLETANHLLNKFFPDDQPDNTDQSIISAFAQSTYSATNDAPFSREEVNDAIATENDSKSPGADSISANIIKNINKLFPTLYFNIFNACLELSAFPKSWKLSTVKIIPKLGSNLQTAKAFRPISLLSVTGKIFEKLIYKRLLFWIHQHPTGLSNNQYGFRPQRSTDDAINVIVNKRNEILNKKHYGIFISLDVAGAFDSAWWSLIISSLMNLNIPKNIIEILKSYFTDRKASLVICGEKAEKSLSRGCPQGAKCSPLLWNILYDNLLKLQLPIGCYLQAFADDAFLIVTHEKLDVCENRANKALARIFKWGNQNKIEFNPNKTQAMLISKKRKTRDIVLQINGSRIELVNSLKYLGVIIENKNKWNLHLDMISKKSLKLYHQIMRTTGKEWGLSGEVLRTIYTVAIEPILTYACSSWHGRSFAISIIKGYRTISTEAAIVLANIDPLDLKILYCTNRYHLKRGNPTNNCIDLIPFQLRAPFSNRLHPALSTNMESRNCPQHHRIDIFTDGSKIDNQTGCAFAAIENNNIIHSTKLRLADECSVFQAELLAILQAIQWCIANDLDARIHCDSQAAIKAVCSRYTSDDLALTIQRMVNSYNKHICLTWVKAHTPNILRTPCPEAKNAQGLER
ncbi:hypothetical protein DERP_014489 [Dermatophagoides pteronyssinus]|uniref:Uncharacterized protein n=1 Tax=Dermatophagoides pteronyssinus TaxID=6956 RepID=A0ABQ8IUI2_DERPT|nr:hypothetical protein DERP_014489 [Dermatophagoides pteronyssinus]